jgi:outer membrane protein TolC
LVRRILQHNESVQVRVLEAEISQRTHKAEYGIFEPQTTASIERTDSRRPNNSQQIASLGFSALPVLNERNTIQTAGLDFLSPIGTKMRLGFTWRDLGNNIQQHGNEVETFAGANLTQPLLKNFGPAATLARIRLSAVASDIAYQEYRKQVMLVVSQAESVYWDLYLMQEQERISRQSVAIASKILQDSKARHEVGRGTQTDVLQAEAAVAQREAKAIEAHFKTLEAISRLSAFFSEPHGTPQAGVRAVDAPVTQWAPVDKSQAVQKAYLSNPDYLIRQRQFEQDGVRLKYARNQRLPQVDMKANYGFNGLGRSLNSSLSAIDAHDNPIWSVALELNVPVLGGVKESNDLAAARLGRARSLLAIEEAQVQIGSAIASAITKIQTFGLNLTSHQKVVDNLEALLASQIARMEAGTLENRFVLETEDKLSEARIAVFEDQVQHSRALLELNLVRGATLEIRNLEVSKYELASRTRKLLDDRKWSMRDFDHLQETDLKPVGTPR